MDGWFHGSKLVSSFACLLSGAHGIFIPLLVVYCLVSRCNAAHPYVMDDGAARARHIQIVSEGERGRERAYSSYLPR